MQLNFCSKLPSCQQECPVNYGPRQLRKRYRSFVKTIKSSMTVAAKPAQVSVSVSGTEVKPTFWDVELPTFQENDKEVVDLIIAGAGPSGLAVADRVSKQGLQVVVVDPNPLGDWPNNYGVWVDEFEQMGLGEYIDIVWPKAKVFLGSNSQTDNKFLNRAYGRVDRYRLKKMLLQKCVDQGVQFVTGKVSGSEQYQQYQEVILQSQNGTKRSVRGLLVLDATGHVRKLVEFNKEFDPGYQGAYGIMADVDSHPFDLDTMIFMDWRDEHCQNDPKMKASNDALPTFLYVMPISDKKVFMEETSLVARPAVPFDQLKQRLYKRLDSLGVQVNGVEEEEFCLIPMGGVLPKVPQRVLGIGGTAGMVHPSTGYMVARSLGAVPSLADSIVEEISNYRQNQISDDSSSQITVDMMSENTWYTLWPLWRIRQRDFFNFGMEVLIRLDLQQTREFFRAFFSLQDYQWQGFLSAKLTFDQLIIFGLSLFSKASWEIRRDIILKGAPDLPLLFYKIASSYGERSTKKEEKK
eukprot:TRINITY_DN6342_c0_g1_i1.p1 TRINITY_DN6342_c0_g1~~TRINITY_DN6342_c0_g1_i1.p1  ORF type:complete len:522 (-),score=84.63 TRINITY_DN6342_c0_g1_i1:2127-3692(-)